MTRANTTHDPQLAAMLKRQRERSNEVHVGLYVRISNDSEGLELGVKRQEEDLRNHVQRMNPTSVTLYRDNDRGASSLSKTPRPDYDRMLADARAGRLTHIAAYTSSRLTRRMRQNEDLIDLAGDYGTRFTYINSPTFDLNTADGRQIARTLAAADAAEAERTGERLKRAKDDMRLKGKWLGSSRPHGYERGGMVVREDEAALIKDGIGRATAGQSLKSLAAEWQRIMPPRFWNIRQVEELLKLDPSSATPEELFLLNDGKRILDEDEDNTLRDVMRSWVDRRLARPGAVWRGPGIKKILLNPRNAGLVVDPHTGTVVGKARWPAIVTEDEWLAARAVLTDPKRQSNPGRYTRRWVGSSFYRCGVDGCGGLMYSATQRRGKGSTLPKVPVYRCYKAGHLCIQAAVVDEKVIEYVTDLLATDGASLIAKAPGVDVEGLRRQREGLRRRRMKLARAYSQGRFDLDEWAEARDGIDAQLSEVEAELATIASGSALAGVADAEDPVAAFEATADDIDRRRTLIGEMVTVTILPYKAVAASPVRPGVDAKLARANLRVVIEKAPPGQRIGPTSGRWKTAA